MELTRLLVGDDGSTGAVAAQAWAQALGGATGARITVVRVADEGDRAGGAEGGGTGEHRVVVGVAAPSLLAAADDVGADLVVIGRRGAGGFEALRLGSTAHQVAEHEARPVAVIPEFFRAAQPGWPFTKIAAGHDGSRTGAAAVTWAAELAARSAATVVVVHALELAPAFAAAGLADAYEQARTRVAAEVDRAWSAPLREAGVTYSTVVEEGGPAAVLLEAVRFHEADLLVVGRRAQGAFPGMAMGSVAHRALGFSPCPTVVVPVTV